MSELTLKIKFVSCKLYNDPYSRNGYYTLQKYAVFTDGVYVKATDETIKDKLNNSVAGELCVDDDGNYLLVKISEGLLSWFGYKRVPPDKVCELLNALNISRDLKFEQTISKSKINK